MSGYDFHPQARFDVDEIWDFIRADNLDSLTRIIRWPEFVSESVQLGTVRHRCHTEDFPVS